MQFTVHRCFIHTCFHGKLADYNYTRTNLLLCTKVVSGRLVDPLTSEHQILQSVSGRLDELTMDSHDNFLVQQTTSANPNVVDEELQEELET